MVGLGLKKNGKGIVGDLAHTAMFKTGVHKQGLCKGFLENIYPQLHHLLY
jgi:hypothetical protein